MNNKKEKTIDPTVQRLLENIKEARRKRGYSQENVADDIGIQHTTYGKIERGILPLTVARLEKIARSLKTKVSDLYPSLTDETIIEGKFRLVKIKENFDTYKASQNEA